MKKITTILALLVITSIFSQIPSYVPTTSLVAYWPFNGNANDLSGNGNNGTVNGATLTADRYGNANNAFYFSSSACSTRIDAQVDTSSVQTGLTISIWVLQSGNGCISPRILEYPLALVCPQLWCLPAASTYLLLKTNYSVCNAFN